LTYNNFSIKISNYIALYIPTNERRSPGMYKHQLLSKLAQYGIDLSMFGIGVAKTTEDLLAEINNGESVLLGKDNQLYRKTQVVSILIYFQHPTKGRQVLREIKQVFEDGRERSRDNLGMSIAEKLKPGESWENGARRGLAEELGIDSSQIDFTFVRYQPTQQASQSYPGLTSIHHIYHLIVTLDNSLYNPNGYKETQDKKTTFFEWTNDHNTPVN
jgi:hypothetical protein